jgi:hypothetical protein
MQNQASRLKRGLTYGSVAAIAGAALPALGGTIACIVQGQFLPEAVIVALVWGAVFGFVGLIVGSCQPAPCANASANSPTGRTGFWHRIGHWVYLLVVGFLIGMIIVSIVELLWVGVFFASEGWNLNNQARPTPIRMLLMSAATAAMGSSAAAAFVGSMVGAFLGATIPSEGARSRAVRTAIGAALISVPVGAVLGTAPGFILYFDMERMHAFRSSPDLALGSAAVFIIAIGIGVGVAAAVLAWWLQRRSRGQATPVTI